MENPTGVRPRTQCIKREGEVVFIRNFIVTKKEMKTTLPNLAIIITLTDPLSHHPCNIPQRTNSVRKMSIDFETTVVHTRVLLSPPPWK